MKIKCFTHGDLDGVISNTLFCRYYKALGYGHSTENCSTGEDVDTKIIAYINNTFEYDKSDIIIITDVCMSYQVASVLNNLPNKKIHLDHHDTSLKMLSKNNPNGTDFDWSHIEEGDSATMLVYRYREKVCVDVGVLDILKQYRPLVVVTDLWDTKPRDSQAYINWRPRIEEILALMSALGWAGTKARFMINPSIELTDVEHAKVDTIKKIKDGVMRYTNVYVRPVEYKGVKSCYGACFVTLYRSDVAEHIFQNNSDLLFTFLIDMNSCKGSLRRSRHKLAEELDLTVIAKQFDEFGGGHPFACGFGFKIDDYHEVIDRIMSANFKLE